MENKKCTKCGILKSIEDFQKTYHKNSNSRRSNCRKCENLRRKYNYDNNPVTRLLMNAKARCRNTDIEFSLNNEDIIIPEKCPILNVKFVLGKKNDYAYSPSLDRIDPDKGYIKGNVKVISSKANRMKTNATKQECLEFAKNIVKYFDDIV